MINGTFLRHRRALIDVAAAYMVATFILGAVVVLWVFKGIPIGHFTRDPANSFNFQFYVGSVSTIGGILWTATATLCIFSANLLRSKEASPEQKEMSNFFLASGLLTLALLFDDVFLFHEKFFPNYLGIQDYFTFPAYAVIALSYLVIFRRVILKTHYLVLIAAGGLLGFGMIVDKLLDGSSDTSIKFLTEDGIKFFGIWTWFVYYARLAIDQCRAQMGAR